MLSRYKIYDRQKRPLDDPKPDGETRDTRYRCNHIVAPTKEMVQGYLGGPSDTAWSRFKLEYFELLEGRFRTRRDEFDELAFHAMMYDYYLGCSCPTLTNYEIDRCHTELALTFMKQRYPDLVIFRPRPKVWLDIHKRGRSTNR